MLFPHIALQNTVSSDVDSVRSSKQIGLYQHFPGVGWYQSPSRGLRPEPSAASAAGAFPDLRFLKCSFTRSETACLLSSTLAKISSNSYPSVSLEPPGVSYTRQKRRLIPQRIR